MRNEQVVDIFFSTAASFGSGYRISSRLILTAKHVVDPCEIGTSCHITFLGHLGPSLMAHCIWISNDYDAALLALSDDPRVRPPYTMAFFGIIPRDYLRPVPCKGIGFPEAQAIGSINEERWLRGTLEWVQRGGRFDINVETPIPVKASLWGGFSGCAVFVEDFLVAIVQSYTTAYGGHVLKGLPFEYLLLDRAFCQHLEADGYASPPPLTAYIPRTERADAIWDSASKGIVIAISSVFAIGVALFFLTAPLATSPQADVVNSAIRLGNLAKLDNFVAVYLGRPGEQRGEMTRTSVLFGNRDQYTMLKSFDDISADIESIQSELRAFVNGGFTSCKTSNFAKYGREIAVSANKLDEVVTLMRNRGLLHIKRDQLTPVDLLYLSDALSYRQDWAFGSILFGRRFDPNWLCMQLTFIDLNGITRDNTAIIQLGLPIVRQTEITPDEHNYVDDIRRYRANLRVGDPYLTRFTTRRLPDFYRSFDEEIVAHGSLLRSFVQIESPVLHSRILGVPLNILIAAFPLFCVVSYLISITKLETSSSRMRQINERPYTDKKRGVHNYLGLPVLGVGERKLSPARISLYAFASMPLLLSIICSLLAVLWVSNPDVPNPTYWSVDLFDRGNPAFLDLITYVEWKIPGYGASTLIYVWLSTFVAAVVAFVLFVRKRRRTVEALGVSYVAMNKDNQNQEDQGAIKIKSHE